MSTPSLRDLSNVFFRIGILSFGGPAAQIALLHRELVEERDWITEKDYLAALSFCMLLPGPEAMQLATYTGWRLRGVMGGLIAGALFIIPGALVVLALSVLYAYLGNLPVMQALFLGVQAAVVIIVIEALIRVAKRALKTPAAWAIALAAFLGIFVFGLPFPVIIIIAGLLGAMMTRTEKPESVPAASVSHTFKTIAIWGIIWLAPLALLLPFGGILTEIALFFSQLAIVTFGGAYAVLAWMTDTAVSVQGWLSTEQMIDGLGLAETTPGPLILVTEFVGFQAAFNQGGLFIAILAALVTLWATFIPSFLFIFAGAPWTLWIASKPRLAAALSGVTAAITGVILNLSLWFAAHVFFDIVEKKTYGWANVIIPNWTSLNGAAAGIAVIAALLIFRTKLNLPSVLGICAGLGWASQAIGL